MLQSTISMSPLLANIEKWICEKTTPLYDKECNCKEKCIHNKYSFKKSVTLWPDDVGINQVTRDVVNATYSSESVASRAVLKRKESERKKWMQKHLARVEIDFEDLYVDVMEEKESSQPF